MNGQSASFIAFKLKKLMAGSASGTSVADNVRAVLETDRILRAERYENVVQEPMRLLITHGMANSTRL